jgi:AP-2 complex subunit alpha
MNLIPLYIYIYIYIFIFFPRLILYSPLYYVLGDFVSENVWHRVIQIVTNNSSVQEYAANKFFSTLQMRWAHEVAVALGGYILGEYGMNICENPGMGGYDQFAALHQHYSSCSPKTQAVLLTTYAKIVNLYPDTRELIVDFLEKMSSSPHVDLQQRACEYLKLPTMPAMMEAVLKEMPLYPEDRENKLVKADIRGSVIGQASAPLPLTMTSKPVSLPSANVSKPIDLISLDDHDVHPPPVPASDGRKLMNLSSEQALQIKSYYNALLTTPAGKIGLLLDDECLVVNLVCEYKAHLGRVRILLNIINNAISLMYLSLFRNLLHSFPSS